MRYLHTTIKMSIACVITILIADWMGLTHAITAGILAVLSIQLTRTDSYRIAVKRLINAFIGLLTSTVFFVLLGYQIEIFLIFIFLFIGLSFKLGLPEGIVPTLVLVSQLLQYGAYDAFFVLEQLGMITLAIGIALLLNVIYPLNTQKAFEHVIKQTDQALKDHVWMLGLMLKDIEQPADYLVHYDQMNTMIKRMLKEAETIDKDILFDNDHRFLSYLEMRKAQLERINQIYEMGKTLKTFHPNMILISDYIKNLSHDIGHYDKASGQLIKLESLLSNIKAQDLPKTRTEFETRAVLFQMINELKAFLNIKITYHKTYPDIQLSTNKRT